MVGSLLAAGLVGLGVIGGGYAFNRDGRSVGGSTQALAPKLPVSDTVVRFVFAAPAASNVSLVGDFNDWDATKTQMVRADNGQWTVTLPLKAGRHLYAFVVDGTTWKPDPSAPIAGDDDFGHTNSVKVVHRGSAL